MNRLDGSTVNEIFRIVGIIVCWALAVFLGFTVFITVAEWLIAIASTGIGAIAIVIICWRLWKRYTSNKDD